MNFNFYANILENKEPVIGDPYFFQTKEEIEDWLKKMKIKNYIINNDLTVYINGAVFLFEKKIKKIPVKFDKINGSFSCNNNKLTSLKGCPEKVRGNFNCSHNELTSLEYFPKEIIDEIDYITIISCNNNKLTSLKGCIHDLSGVYFFCENNQLNSLEYLPIAQRYGIRNNPIKTLKNLSVVNVDLLKELSKYYPELDWKDIEWNKVKNMNEIITDIYRNIENSPRYDGKSPDRDKWEQILKRLEDVGAY